MPGLLDNLYFDVNGLSKHIGSDAPYNESNIGFGLTAEIEKNKVIKGLLAGTYKNSYNKNSKYLAGSLAKRFGDKYYIDVGGFGGLVTGYDDIALTEGNKKYNLGDYNKINPLAGAMVNLGIKDRARLGIKYMPGKPHVVMMNLGIPIK